MCIRDRGLVSSDKTLVVVNKSDLGIENMLEDFSQYNPIYISIIKEKNIDTLISTIRNKLKNKFLSNQNILITRERHRLHLEQCLNHLENFENKRDEQDFDKAAEDLRLAARELGKIVGKFDVEEILGSIFSDFCIGK